MPNEIPFVHDVLEALSKPVYVADTGDTAAVFEALLEAWRERVPAFQIEEGGYDTPHGSSILFVGMKVNVRREVMVGEEATEDMLRSGTARVLPDVDPWEAYQLAFVRACHMWGLRAVQGVEPDLASLERMMGSGGADGIP